MSGPGTENRQPGAEIDMSEIRGSPLKEDTLEFEAPPMLIKRRDSPLIKVTPPENEVDLPEDTSDRNFRAAASGLPRARPLGPSNSLPEADFRRRSLCPPILPRKSSLCFEKKALMCPSEQAAGYIMTTARKDCFLTPDYRRRESRPASFPAASSTSSFNNAFTSKRKILMTNDLDTRQPQTHQNVDPSPRFKSTVFTAPHRRYSTDGSISILSLSFAEKKALSNGLEQDALLAEMKKKTLSVRKTTGITTTETSTAAEGYTDQASSDVGATRPRSWAWDRMRSKGDIPGGHDQDELLSSVEMQAMEVLVPVRASTGFYFKEADDDSKRIRSNADAEENDRETQKRWSFSRPARIKRRKSEYLKARGSTIFPFYAPASSNGALPSAEPLYSCELSKFRLITNQISANISRAFHGTSNMFRSSQMESCDFEQAKPQVEGKAKPEDNPIISHDISKNKPSFWRYPLSKHFSRTPQNLHDEKKPSKLAIPHIRRVTRVTFRKKANLASDDTNVEKSEPRLSDESDSTGISYTKSSVKSSIGPKMGDGSLDLEETFPPSQVINQSKESCSELLPGDTSPDITISNELKGSISWTNSLPEFCGDLGHVHMRGARPISDVYWRNPCGLLNKTFEPLSFEDLEDIRVCKEAEQQCERRLGNTSLPEDLREYTAEPQNMLTAGNSKYTIDGEVGFYAEESKDEEQVVESGKGNAVEGENCDSGIESDEDVKLHAMLCSEGRTFVQYSEAGQEGGLSGSNGSTSSWGPSLLLTEKLAKLENMGYVDTADGQIKESKIRQTCSIAEDTNDIQTLPGLPPLSYETPPVKVETDLPNSLNLKSPIKGFAEDKENQSPIMEPKRNLDGYEMTILTEGDEDGDTEEWRIDAGVLQYLML